MRGFFISTIILIFAVVFMWQHLAAAQIIIGSGEQPRPGAPLLLERSGGGSLEGRLGEVISGGFYEQTRGSSPQWVVANIIRYSLSFLGIIFLIVVLYAGFQWMTAGGNEERITKAKKFLANGAIGLGVVLASLSLWIFIVEKIYIATSEAPEEQFTPKGIEAQPSDPFYYQGGF